MRHLFRHHPDACDNTLWIAERAGVEIEFGNPSLPEFPIPAGHTAESFLRELVSRACTSATARRCPPRSSSGSEYELGVIADMGFPDYFLVVWDLIRHARETGIRVGPGRGARRARSSPTRCASPTCARSSTTCCSSGSSTRAASRCPTSTWTSTSATAAR